MPKFFDHFALQLFLNNETHHKEGKDVSLRFF